MRDAHNCPDAQQAYQQDIFSAGVNKSGFPVPAMFQHGTYDCDSGDIRAQGRVVFVQGHQLKNHIS